MCFVNGVYQHPQLKAEGLDHYSHQLSRTLINLVGSLSHLQTSSFHHFPHKLSPYFQPFFPGEPTQAVTRDSSSLLS